MSFRIDDILKRGTSPSKCSNYEPYPPLDGDLKFTREQHSYSLYDHKSSYANRCLNNSDSILQQTLLNRSDLFPPRTTSDYFKPNKFTGNPKLYSPYPLYPDSYLDKVHQYSHFHSRSRVWPIYPLPISSMLTYQFGQFSKRKGGQVRFTATQTDALEKRFLSHKYLSPEDRKILANSLKLTDRQVKTWFQNRRAKWRRCNSVSSNTTSEHQDDSGSEDLFEVSASKTCVVDSSNV